MGDFRAMTDLLLLLAKYPVLSGFARSVLAFAGETSVFASQVVWKGWKEGNRAKVVKLLQVL